MRKEVVKKTVHGTINTKVNSLEKKSSDVSTLIETNHYNTYEKLEMLRNKIPDISGLVTIIFLNTKINKVEGKIPDAGSLVTTAVFNTKSWKKNCYLSSLVKENTALK